MFQNTLLWLQNYKGNQHKRERQGIRAHQHDSVHIVTKVRYARVNTYHGNIDDVQLAHCVTDKLVQHVLLFFPFPLFCFSSTPPRPDVPQLKVQLHRCPCHVQSTLASRRSATLPLLREQSFTGHLSQVSRCTHSQMFKSVFLFTTLTVLCDLCSSSRC